MTSGDHKGSQGEAAGKSTDYVKTLEDGGILKVHAPNGIVTGAKLNDTPISNYEAAMLDTQRGETHKDTGRF